MKKLILVFLGASLLTFVGCSENQNNQSQANEKKTEIKVGIIAPLSGPGATYGEDGVKVYNDAVNEYNKKAEVKVKLIVEDGKCDGKDSVSAVQKLINVDKVAIILGGLCSSETVGSAKIANANKVTMLSPTASSPEISELGAYIFRFWNDAHASITLAKYLSQYKRIVLLSETTDYAKALANRLKSLYTGEIVREESFVSDEKDFDIIASKLETVNVDAIMMLTQTESTTISLIKSFDKAGLLKRYEGKIIGAYIFSSESFIKAVGSLAEGLVEVNTDRSQDPNSLGGKYLTYFKNTYGLKSVDMFIPLIREGTEIVFEAIRAGARTTEDFKQYFEKITKENPRSGYFGEYYFDDKGDAIGLKYLMEKIENEKPVPLKW